MLYTSSLSPKPKKNRKLTSKVLLTPVLLQRLLASMNDPLSPRNATITYAVISLALRLISAQSFVFNLWYQRRAYERSRGEMVTMLYEKTLNRKILGVKQESQEGRSNGVSHNGTNGHTNGEANGTSNQSKSHHSRLIEILLNAVSRLRSLFSRRDAKKKEEEPASMGKILNLMRNDVYEVSQRFWEFSDIITKPLGVIFATILIWVMLGWSCLIGAVALLITQSANVAIARGKVYFEKKRRSATDEKLKRINQFIESIRHLRWYGWQGTCLMTIISSAPFWLTVVQLDAWLDGVLESRQKELHLRVILIFFSTSIAFIMKFGGGLFPAVAFFAFTKLSGKPLRVDLIFPAIDLFNILDSHLRALPQLLTTLLDAYVAMSRIESFMEEPDKEKSDMVPEGSTGLRLRNASFAWPGVEENVLNNVTLSFPQGLTVVYGEV